MWLLHTALFTKFTVPGIDSVNPTHSPVPWTGVNIALLQHLIMVDIGTAITTRYGVFLFRWIQNHLFLK